MGAPSTFVGFSGTDIRSYWLMKAWKENEKIDFDFRDCQLSTEIRSEDEAYIKARCRERIAMASKFVQLIGEDTKNKYKYVRWEAEVAIEKGCTIIGVNLNGDRVINDLCPPILRGIGAIFTPFSPKIIKYALDNYSMKQSDNYNYPAQVYANLGYK